MPAQNRSTPLPYAPALPPDRVEDFSRATWEEFQRIAEALSQMDRPMAGAWYGGETVHVASGNPTWSRLLDASPTESWANPEGVLSAAGVWTCPQEGLYQGILAITMQAPAVTGSNSVRLEVRATITHGDGSSQVFTRVGGGSDAYPYSATSPFMLPCLRGDTVVFDARGIHSKAGTDIQVAASLTVQLVRVSGVR